MIRSYKSAAEWIIDKEGIFVNLKKIGSVILILGVLLGGAPLANAQNIPTERCGGAHEPLYGKYPMAGANEATAFYLDPSSCYYTIDGNKATMECLVYGTGGGAAPEGGPAFLTQYTFTFQTYKKDGRRRIVLRSAVSKSRQGRISDCTQSMLKYDDGFLGHLFWMVADAAGIRADLK